MKQLLGKLLWVCLGSLVLVSIGRFLHPATFSTAVPLELGVAAAGLGLLLLRHE